MQTGRRGLTRSQLKTVALRHITFGNSIMSGQSMISINVSHEIDLPDLFFRLTYNDVELYKSEIASKTLNPVWAAVELSDDSINKFLHDDGKDFDIVVYRVCTSSTMLMPMVDHAVVEEVDEDDEEEEVEDYDADNISFTGLPVSASDEAEYFEEEVFRFNVELDELEPLHCDFRELYYLPLNTLVLGFKGNQYFVRRDVLSMLVQNGMILSRRAKDIVPQLPQNTFVMGTAAKYLDDNIELLRQIKEKQVSIAKKRQAVEELLANEEEASAKENARLQLQSRIMELRKQVIQKKQALDQVKSVLKVEKHMLSTDQRLPRTLTQLTNLEAKETEMNSGIIHRRMDILRVAHSIRALQATLVSQLYDIYPIAYLGAGEYSIGGIKFTNSDINNGRDEEMLSTALGYIAHFVFLLAKYLNVTLRYAIKHVSSRSSMCDEVNDPGGEYPLYKRGADRERFEKAFVFLKKDIEQWRSSPYTVGGAALLKQEKAQITELCRIEVEETKAILDKQLAREKKRYKKELEEREKKSEDFCIMLRTRYETMLADQDLLHQTQLTQIQDLIQRTYISFTDHKRILSQRENDWKSEQDKCIQHLKSDYERLLHDIVQEKEVALQKMHQNIVEPLRAKADELQKQCKYLKKQVDRSSKGIA
ncbi:unnamed protein product [Aphanomyces euteiches]